MFLSTPSLFHDQTISQPRVGFFGKWQIGFGSIRSTCRFLKRHIRGLSPKPEIPKRHIRGLRLSPRMCRFGNFRGFDFPKTAHSRAQPKETEDCQYVRGLRACVSFHGGIHTLPGGCFCCTNQQPGLLTAPMRALPTRTRPNTDRPARNVHVLTPHTRVCSLNARMHVHHALLFHGDSHGYW